MSGKTECQRDKNINFRMSLLAVARAFASGFNGANQFSRIGSNNMLRVFFVLFHISTELNVRLHKDLHLHHAVFYFRSS